MNKQEKIKILNQRVGQYKRSNNVKCAQIRFYKLQLKTIKERIEKILEMEHPTAEHHNFDFVRKKH